MNRRLPGLFLASACLVLLPFRAPAPLIYTPGEGWTYEQAGTDGRWKRATAKEQLIVAQDALDKKDHGVALKAARHVVSAWPRSDYAPQAQYIIGRCYEARHLDERAFKEYQKLIDNYPNAANYREVLQRQYEIANRFLDGQWIRLWGYIPFFPSMDRTADLFDKVVKNGPYSELAPSAQLKIGQARVKQANFPEAVKAYARAADRDNDQPAVASDAIFKVAEAYKEQAQKAEYDQGTAGHAIATFTDFMTLYPDDPRVPEAKKQIAALRMEQARGNFEIAQFYEKNRKWTAARTYYNEVVDLLLGEPDSDYAVKARERIDAMNKLLLQAANR